MTDDDNWLNAKVVQCPNCKTSLFQVDHSPMLDNWRLYCDGCPKSVEVSFYDKVVETIRLKFPAASHLNEFFEEIQNQLKDCVCGGRYRFNAVRRCFECGSSVVDDPNVDLYVLTGCELDDRDPTAEEEAIYLDWEKRFVVEKGVWE